MGSEKGKRDRTGKLRGDPWRGELPKGGREKKKKKDIAVPMDYEPTE